MIGILIFICFSFLPSISSEEITTQILYVGGNGAGNYTRIQEALENASADDTVYVFPGRYYETLRITTPIHLIGSEVNTTIIDGGNEDFVVTLEAGNSTLSGFTITHSQQKFPFAGVYVISNHNTIAENILTDNFYGMQLGHSASYNLIANNTISHNGRCGIYFNHASHNSLIGNVVFDHPVNGFGLYEFSNNNSIMGNTFSDNRDTAVNIRESYDNQVTKNIFVQGHVALHTPTPEYHTVTYDNQFTNNLVSLEEERDAFVVTVMVYAFLIFLVFLIFGKVLK